MSIVKEKPYLDPVLKIQHQKGRQEIKQKDSHYDVFKIYSCLKELETANFETLIPKMKFSTQSKPSIQPDKYLLATELPTTNLPAIRLIPPNLCFVSGRISGKTCRVEESDCNFLQPVKRSLFNFVRLTESSSSVTGRATALCACPKAPEARN